MSQYFANKLNDYHPDKSLFYLGAVHIHHLDLNLMNDVVNSGLSAGKDPMGLAATVVYASCISAPDRLASIISVRKVVRIVIDTYDHFYCVGYVCHTTPRDVHAQARHRT